jgi:translocator protein
MLNKNRKLNIILNLIGLIFALLMNFLALSLPLNGKSTKDLSEQYTNLFVPAPIAFSIWSIIYLFLIIFVGISLFKYHKSDEKSLSLVDSIGSWFWWSCVANGLWIITWHYEKIFFSVIVMLFLLFSLSKIYVNLVQRRPLPINQSIWTLVPFSVYLGWISVATIANFAAFFVSIQWAGLGISPLTWTKIVIGIAIMLAIIMVLKFQDLVFALVVIWALFCIYYRHYGSISNDEKSISFVALTGFIFLSIYTFMMLVGKKSYLFDKELVI